MVLFYGSGNICNTSEWLIKSIDTKWEKNFIKAFHLKVYSLISFELIKKFLKIEKFSKTKTECMTPFEKNWFELNLY